MPINGSNESRIYHIDPEANDGLEWGEVVDGWTSMVFFGPEFDPDAPVAALIVLTPGPGDALRGRHVHDTDAINLVVQGSMRMDGVWLTPGMMKAVPAGVEYSDAIVGPDGCKYIEIMAQRKGMRQTYVNPDTQKFFESHPHYSHFAEIAEGRREGSRVKE